MKEYHISVLVFTEDCSDKSGKDEVFTERLRCSSEYFKGFTDALRRIYPEGSIIIQEL